MSKLLLNTNVYSAPDILFHGDIITLPELEIIAYKQIAYKSIYILKFKPLSKKSFFIFKNAIKYEKNYINSFHDGKYFILKFNIPESKILPSELNSKYKIDNITGDKLSKLYTFLNKKAPVTKRNQGFSLFIKIIV